MTTYLIEKEYQLDIFVTISYPDPKNIAGLGKRDFRMRAISCASVNLFSMWSCSMAYFTYEVDDLVDPLPDHCGSPQHRPECRKCPITTILLDSLCGTSVHNSQYTRE